MSYKNDLQDNNTDLQTVLNMAKKLPNAIEIVQSTGDSETVVMSQKAVTEALDEIDLKTPKNLTEAQKKQARDNIGVENVLESVGSDTLTWDGNTEGLVNLADTFFKVSNAVPPTPDELANGATVKMSQSAGLSPEISFTEIGQGFFISTNSECVVIQESSVGIEIEGIIPQEPGVYLVNQGGIFVSSLTIPGYTGFVKKQVNPEYLPESDILVAEGGDTLTWDGNTEGLVSVLDVYYKVSDVVITAEDIGSLSEAGNNLDDTKVKLSTGEFMSGGFLAAPGFIAIGEVCFIISEEAVGIDFDGLYFQEAGIYFAYLAEEGAEPVFASSLTIPGYTGFVKKQVNPEYLPKTSWNNLADRPFYVASIDFSTMKLSMTPAEIHAVISVGGTVMFSISMTPIGVDTDETGITAVYATMIAFAGVVDGMANMACNVFNFDTTDGTFLGIKTFMFGNGTEVV